jgi:hypothetical protein
MLLDLEVVTCAPVVEARLDLERERHLAPHDDDPSHQAVAVVGDVGALDRHEILDLPHAVGREEARDEDVRVGKVELAGGPVAGLGAQ